MQQQLIANKRLDFEMDPKKRRTYEDRYVPPKFPTLKYVLM